MERFLGFISQYGTIFIIVVGAVCLLFLIKSWVQLSLLRDEIQKTLNVKKGRAKVDRSTRTIVQKVEYSRLRTEADDLRERFDKASSSHYTISQMIPIFPLLGILGTVAGLILGLQEGLEHIQEGLSTAMDTTLWGLIFAIGLKVLDNIGPGKAVYMVTDDLEEYERRYKDAVDTARFEEGF
jgi:biopolymer transport protein ExbB/TolQ